MLQSPSFRTLTFTLGANEERTINASGSILTVLTADGTFEISFGDDSFFEAEAGLGFEPFDPSAQTQTFKTLRFRDTSGAANAVRVQIGTGKIYDNRLVFGTVELPVKTGPGTILDVNLTDAALPRAQTATAFYTQFSGAIAAGANVIVSPTNMYVSRVLIENFGTETVYANDGTTLPACSIAPGEVREFFTTFQIYVSNPASIPVTVRCVREGWTP